MPEHQENDLAYVQRWAAKLKKSYLECRTLGHAWKAHTANWIDDQRVWEQVVRCQRCRGERIRLLDRNGYVLSTQYRYAPRYLHHGVGRLTADAKAVLRVEELQRDAPASSSAA
jgi:hypothetical protein